jgi:2-dehydro-3-deoxyphosphooctonate aldolase (KDO 8-P synthase)
MFIKARITMQSFTYNGIEIGDYSNLFFISGPCVIESLDHTLHCAETLQKIFSNAGIPFIFKASFDKANRSSIHSFRGPGLEKGLEILNKVKQELGLGVTTDLHEASQANAVAEVCDILQIPAFLSRQTDLVLAAAETGNIVHVKKGQFMAPWDMKNVVEKVREVSDVPLFLTDRGTSFGYNNLVCDMRAIPIMRSFGVPVCFDASHSVQLPGGHGTSSGGQREFIPTLTKAAIAAGADIIFLESHPNPSEAKSDANSVYPFSELPQFLENVKRLFDALHNA